jgi:DNA polymerase-3 subunit epsilon
MEIILETPLIVLDIEATGDQVTKDRIVELGMIKVFNDGTEEVFEKRINPEIPIPLKISEIHGIYDIDVKDCPSFKELANQIKDFIGKSNLCGFNSNKFDIPILEEEFLRAGVQINFNEKKLIDVQNIFHKMEKRTLGAAYKFYCNKEIKNAHSAIHDARATLEVLKSQTKKI